MTHIYLVKRPGVEANARREMLRAEINILRKFEGRSLIEERIERCLGDLHRMTFSSSRRARAYGR